MAGQSLARRKASDLFPRVVVDPLQDLKTLVSCWKDPLPDIGSGFFVYPSGQLGSLTLK